MTLTHYQSRVVMGRIPELHAAAMREHRVPHGPKAHRYDLPAIAWRQIRDHLWLNPAYYGPLGGKLDSQPKALYRAIQLVHQAVLEMEHHPALAGAAITGRHAVILPAFTLHSARIWDPYPQPQVSSFFVTLIPRMVDYHGREMTIWEQGSAPPDDSWTYREEAHLMFSGQPQVYAGRQDL